MTEDWLGRWNQGRIGWHERDGNRGLKAHWPRLSPGTSVLVPLCGKSQDMLWLADRGCRVTGVEISPLAVEQFFVENGLQYERRSAGAMTLYSAVDRDIDLYCGDYFGFRSTPFDALYDRGALVSLEPEGRAAYAAHTSSLLSDAAVILVVTLEYDQSQVAGPPFSVMPAELCEYWPKLFRVAEVEDIENAPPKFRAAGLSRMAEVVWLSAADSRD